MDEDTRDEDFGLIKTLHHRTHWRYGESVEEVVQSRGYWMAHVSYRDLIEYFNSFDEVILVDIVVEQGMRKWLE